MKLCGFVAGGVDGSVSEDALTRDMITREIMAQMKTTEKRGEHHVKKLSEQMNEMNYRHKQEMREIKNEIDALKSSGCDAGKRKNKRHVVVSSSRRGISSTTMAFIVSLMLQVLFINSDLHQPSWGNAAPAPPTRKRGHQSTPLAPRRHQQKEKIVKSKTRADADGWTDPPVLEPASAMKSTPRLVRRGDNINQQLGDINAAPVDVQSKRMASHSNYNDDYGHSQENSFDYQRSLFSFNSTSSTPACEGADPKVCGCASVKQADYRGSINTTIDGTDCLPWPEDMLKAYPYAGLEDGAFCRNPTPDDDDEDGYHYSSTRAWCYRPIRYVTSSTSSSSYEENCNIPVCGAERNVLKSLFDSSNGPQWTNKTNWNVENISHCDWHGVTCDAANHTIKLELPSNGLGGNLNRIIGTLSSLQVLDLSNNDIKGSIPMEIMWLLNLDYFRISYNSFIGEVPEQLGYWTNPKLVHLHGNKLSGSVPSFRSKGFFFDVVKDVPSFVSFVADCGKPSDYDLSCESCTMCCNDDGFCRDEVLEETDSLLENASSPIMVGLFSALLFGALFYLAQFFYIYDKCKNRTLPAPSIRRPSTTERDNDYALEAIGQDSVYRFFLSKSWWGWIFAFATISMQIAVLFPFLEEAGNYIWQCPRNSDRCVAIDGGATWIGWTVFGIMMAVHLLKDLINGSKLIKLSGQARHTRNERIRYFFGGVFLIFVSLFTLYVSAIYNNATAQSDTDMIKESVVILFVTQIDEFVYGILGAIDKSWTDKTSKAVRAQDFKNDIEELYERIRLLQLQIEENEGNNTQSQYVNANSGDGSRRSRSRSRETTPSQGNETKPQDVEANSDDGSRRRLSRSGVSGSQSSDGELSS